MVNKTAKSPDAGCAVNNLITFAHVRDVETSTKFYALLGFAAERVLRDPHGNAYWARLRSGRAEIMFARASGPIDAGQQAVLFYMYCDGVAQLRQHLLDSGLRDGGRFVGAGGPDDGSPVVFTVTHPDYMPAGEIRVADPDGYCILVGQLG